MCMYVCAPCEYTCMHIYTHIKHGHTREGRRGIHHVANILIKERKGRERKESKGKEGRTGQDRKGKEWKRREDEGFNTLQMF